MPSEYPKQCDNRTISKGEEEELVQRVYYRQLELAEQREKDRQETLERQRKESRKTIPKSSEEELVKRVYEQQMERKSSQKQEYESKQYDEVHRNDKKIDGGALDDHLHHVYDDSIAHTKQVHADLEARYCPTSQPKTLSKGQIQESVTRLYTVDYEARDQKLFEKWVYPNDPKMSRISPSAEAAMATRLSTRE